MHDTVVEKGEPFVVPSGWEGPPDYQPKSYPKSVQIVGEDQPYNCRCAHSPVLARDLPEDLTTLALHPDITVTGVPPDLGSAPGPRAREIMQDRAVAAETFEHWVKREYETADGSHSRLRDNLGVGKATAYDWTGRAGITA